MNTSILNSKIIIPTVTIGLCLVIWLGPLDLDLLAVIFPTIIVLIASFWEYKKDLFRSLGFHKRRITINNTFVLAPLLSIALFLLYYFVLIPYISSLTGESLDFSDYEELKGNLPYSVLMLLFVWVSAALGEEIVWRGYFMKQYIKVFGEGKISIAFNIIIFSILFGCVHNYQGITGVIITGIIGLLLSVTFYLRKYDLWFNVMVHGFFDTIALIVVYIGLL